VVNAKKVIIFGQYGVEKVRLDAVRALRGAVTGRAYFWRKPGVAVKMDIRDYTAEFGTQQEVENDESTDA